MKTYAKRLAAIIVMFILSLGLSMGDACGSAIEKPEQFYRGKTFTWIVASNAGSGTDLTTRAIAPFLGSELGTFVKVINKGTDEGINWVYTDVKADGLTMLSNDSSAVLFNDLLKAPGVQYVSEKFLYVADMSPDSYGLFVSPKRPYRSLDDLRKAKGLKLAGTSAKGMMAVTSAVLLEVLGLDGKVITGYDGATRAMLAVAQGELDLMPIRCTTAMLKVKAGDMIPLFNIPNERTKVFPDLPTMGEFGAKVPKELEDAHNAVSYSGLAVALPPGVAQDRLEYLREIFNRLNTNKDLQGQMVKVGGVFQEFVAGKELQNRIIKMKANQALGSQLDALLNKYKMAK